MRGPTNWALAVRRPCGEIFVSVNALNTLAQRFPRMNVLFVRGIFALVDSLAIGVKSLLMSGAIQLEESEEDGDCDGDAYGDAATGDGAVHEDVVAEAEASLSTWMITVTMILSLAAFLGIFIVLPSFISSLVSDRIGNTFLFNVVEGLIRITIFVGYLALVSLMPDMRRVFEYHGAEHKVVHAYEAGIDLSADNASFEKKEHLRCGTAFIMIIMIISVLVFSCLGRPPLWLRILERLAIIPFLAALSYELIKVAARFEGSVVVRLLMWPGLLLQRITTREPDTAQIEVAIAALDAALSDEKEAVRDAVPGAPSASDCERAGGTACCPGVHFRDV